MMNKVYEIKRADMLNIKEYTVWKHANEEVWEVDDGKTFAGSDSQVMVERKQVIEFDYEGQHYRIYRKEGDVFGKNECLDYMTFKKTVCVAYHRFAEDDFVHITFKDAETDVEPAVTLPKGWNWAEHIAGDGFLEAPSGKAYFCYTVRDWEKEELTYSENINGTRVKFYTGFEMFKEYAETKVRNIWGEMLIKATKNNQYQEMLQLILEGADVNYKDKYGNPPLMWATNHANSHTIELLVQYGADVNWKDASGVTKLMKECSYCNAETIKYLLQHGANPDLADEYGQTAYDYAKKGMLSLPINRTKEMSKIIRLLNRRKYVFRYTALPCSDIKDFETKDVSMDIPCRIYLKQAPSSRHEKIAKELDGEYYSPDNFFIECIAGRNEPDGDLIISGWMLFYVLEDGHIHEFGYVDDVPDNAWDYFKEHMGIGEKKKQKGDIMKRYLVFIKDCYIRDAQALLAGKTGLDNDQSEKEESWRDIAAPVLIMDRYFEDPTQLKMLLTQLYPEADPSIFTVYTVDNMEEHGLI